MQMPRAQTMDRNMDTITRVQSPMSSASPRLSRSVPWLELTTPVIAPM